jgi:hypothetical protein
MVALAGFAIVLGPILLFPEVLPAPVRIPVAVSAAVLALAGAVILARSTVLTLMTLGLTTAVIVGWYRAGPSDSSLAHFTGASAGLLIMNVVGSWCSTEARIRTCLGLVLTVGTLAIVVGLLGTRTPHPKVFAHDAVVRTQPILKLGVPGLASDGYVNPNALGVAALLILPLGCAAALAARGGGVRGAVPVVGGIAGLVSGAIIVLSQSRSAWIAVFLLVVVVACRMGTRWPSRLAALALLGLLCVAGVIGVQQVQDVSFESAINKVRSSSENRREILSQGIGVLRQAPWLGIGMNEFRHRYEVKPYGWPVAHAHNVFLQTALDIGMIGLGWYVALIVMLLVWADRIAHRASPLLAYTAAGAGLSLLGAHLFGLADALALGAKVGAFQWLAAGLIVAANDVSRASEGRSDVAVSHP